MDAQERSGASAAGRAATNQPEPLVGHDVIASDLALVDAVRRLATSPDGVLGSLKDLGQLAGTAQAREHGRLANRNEPELHAFDRFGNRIDEVSFTRPGTG